MAFFISFISFLQTVQMFLEVDLLLGVDVPVDFHLNIYYVEYSELNSQYEVCFEIEEHSLLTVVILITILVFCLWSVF